jgi:LppP/LprE lipoprotein
MRSRNWTISVVVILGLILVGSPAKAAPPGCGVNLAAPEVTSAVNSLPPWQNVGQAVRWDAMPESMSGNFDPCATLSVALASVERGTGSSPWQALLFHKGQYVGTATSKPYAFTSLNTAQTTDDTVVLDYKDGRNVCTACPGPITTVRYQWQGDHVAMLDPAPPW